MKPPHLIPIFIVALAISALCLAKEVEPRSRGGGLVLILCVYHLLLGFIFVFH